MKENTAEQWLDEISAGLTFRRKYGLEEEWKDLEALFYGVHPSTSLFSGPNIVIGTGDALLSALSVPKPVVTLRPRQNTNLNNAALLESVDNDLLDDLDVGEEFDTAFLHAFLWGKGILKVGFDSEYGWDPELDLGGSQPLGVSMSQFNKKGHRIEFGNVRPGMPWVKSVLPHDIVVPWGAKDFKTTPWVAHRVVRHVDDIKADPKYSKTRNLMPVMSMEDNVKSYQTVQKPYRAGRVETWSSSTSRREGIGKEEYCELWEVHDRRTGKIFVVATGHKSFLRNENDQLQVDGLPFVEVTFVPKSRNFWITPDCYYLRNDQAELSDISIQATKQRRLSVLRFLYGEDAFEPEELDKLLSARVGVAAKVKGGMKVSDAIMAFQPHINNVMLYQDGEYVRRNARETVGFSRNEMGEFEQKGRRTATEVNTVKQGSSRRMSRRQIVVRRAYVELVKKLNGTIFKFWQTPRWTEVVGEQGEVEWKMYTASQLQGRYKYSIGFAPESDESREDRKMAALQLYSGLSQDPFVDPIKLRQFFLRAFNDPQLGGLFTDASIQTGMRTMQSQITGNATNSQPKQTA